MTSTLLENEITQPAELRDFFEWHQGIEHYGFWAIEVSDPCGVNIIQRNQQLVENKVHPGYSRQPHITLVASGLLSDTRFSTELLQQQIDSLQQCSPFSICLSKADSFTTCPYISIDDPTNNLNILRDILNSISPEEGYGHYIPHVTLGFYKNVYKMSDILQLLSSIQPSNKNMTVNEIIFARYKTNAIQGPYEVMHRIRLHSKAQTVIS